jgi:hypothetical protein
MAANRMEATGRRTKELAPPEQSPCHSSAHRRSHSPHPPFRPRRLLPFRSKRRTPARWTLATNPVTKPPPDRDPASLRLPSLPQQRTAPGRNGMTRQKSGRKTISRRRLPNRRLPRCSRLPGWASQLAAQIRAALPAPPSLTGSTALRPACPWSPALVLQLPTSQRWTMLPVSLRPLMQQLKSRCVPIWTALLHARTTRPQHLRSPDGGARRNTTTGIL